jgi:hypothetical protein
MAALDRFIAYAQASEETYVDDDWSRLEQFFTPDATYEVRGSPMACRLEGRDAIFRGLKKSIDGFDRKFPSRKLEASAPPTVEGDTVSVPWAGTYDGAGLPPVTIRGRSVARFAGDRIAALADEYDPAGSPDTLAWMMKYGAQFDGSYV